MEFRAAHSTRPAASSAQLGAEYSEPAIFVGVLHAVPLKIVTCKLAALATAAPGMNLNGNPVARLKLVDGGAEFDHRAHILVPGRISLIERWLALDGGG